MRINKKTIGILCLFVMLLATPVTASAYNFSLTMPGYFVGSMRWTSVYQKTSATTPYVDPSINTLPTAYFLTPQRNSTIQATDIYTISNGAKHYFTWESGYGGVGTSYGLAAYPNMSGDWDAYVTRGTWSN